MAPEDDTASLSALAGGDPDGLVGQVIAGKYRVTGVLAKGGMGRVFRAVQMPLDRPVAVKVLHSDVADNEETAARFEQRFFLEAAACAGRQEKYWAMHRALFDAQYDIWHRFLDDAVVAELRLVAERMTAVYETLERPLISSLRALTRFMSTLISPAMCTPYSAARLAIRAA